LTDDATGNHPGRTEALSRALARVSADTGWDTWEGICGLLYARLVRTSPPKVVRATTVDALREAIDREGGHAR
jgi:hypothetical protein